MAFNPEEFVKDVTWEGFDELKKPDLMSLAQFYEIDVKHYMRKQIIKNKLLIIWLKRIYLGKNVWKGKLILMMGQIV